MALAKQLANKPLADLASPSGDERVVFEFAA